MTNYIRKCYKSSEGRLVIAIMHPRHLLNACAKKITGMNRSEISSDREMVALIEGIAKRLNEILYTQEDRESGEVKKFWVNVPKTEK